MTKYKLIGSVTSPYVRRMRLYLDGVPFDFDVTPDIYGKDDERLSAVNPLKKIPVLLVDGKPLYESRVIFNYLQRNLGRPALSLDEENSLSAVDSLQDQLVQQFLMKKYAVPVDPQNPYFARHVDRQRRTISYLDEAARAGLFRRWDYPAMSLYSLLDWAEFRDMLKPAEMPVGLTKLRYDLREKPGVAATDPRHSS